MDICITVSVRVHGLGATQGGKVGGEHLSLVGRQLPLPLHPHPHHCPPEVDSSRPLRCKVPSNRPSTTTCCYVPAASSASLVGREGALLSRAAMHPHRSGRYGSLHLGDMSEPGLVGCHRAGGFGRDGTLLRAGGWVGGSATCGLRVHDERCALYVCIRGFWR